MSQSSAKKKGTDSFVLHNKYGMGGNESEEEDAEILDKVADKTPQTKRRIIKEENLKKVTKLGPLATSFTIFKGFVCTGILYMPKDFINGGWLFSGICVLGSLVLTLYCAHLLLECRAKYGGSFPEIGYAIYGKTGKIMVDISLVASQYGFVTAYIYFIASQIGGPGGVIPCITAEDNDPTCETGVLISKWWFLPICMIIYVPLVFVRKIEVFAPTHLFGDVMIIITMIVICIYAGIDVGKSGWQP